MGAQTSDPSGGSPVLTFVVADVRGYTRFTRERGDAAAAILATRFAELARDAVEARSGRVIELRGDEALAVFRSPAQAVRAALEFQATCAEESEADPAFPLPVGIGIDAGEAVPVEDGYRGVALNMAARLCSNAGAGQVLVTRDVAAAAATDLDLRFVERGPASFKGFEQAVDVIEAQAELGAVTVLAGPGDGALPPELDPLTPFVDREHELRWLRGTWRQVRRGRGRVLFLSGPAQIGKTRLAAELAAHVHRDGGAVRYAGPGGAAAAVAVSAIRDTLAAASPTLLVLDDVEVAGPAVAEALEAALEPIASLPALVLATLRDRSDLPAIETALARADHRGDGIRALAPLDVDGVRGIVGIYVGDDAADVPVEAMARASGGVPGRVHEIVSDWARSEASRRLAAAAEFLAAGRDRHASDLEFANNVIGLKLGRLYSAEGRDVAALTECPYKGLAAFEERDAAYFFGREQLVGELAARLVQAGLLGVVGASGSGKSSVVAAGVLPSLREGLLPGSERWAQATLRPGEHPMEELRASLGVGAEGDPLAAAVEALPPDGRLILAVDQFEETFTLCASEDERAAFIDVIVSAASRAPDRLGVILTLRGDFYAHCAPYPALADALAANHVLIGPLTRDELRRAIELPGRRAGVRIESALADELIEEVAGEPGGLPLLSTALVELWGTRDDDGWIRMGAYERTGGVRGAVARLAESSYEQLSDAERDAARRVFLRLTGGEGESMTRRRVPLDEFDLDRDLAAAAVLTKMTQDRLLTMGDDTVEVAHEALLREWPRLQGWVEDDAQGRQLRQHLAQVSRQWDARGREPSELYRGARLSAALDWSTVHAADLNELEREFLAAGRQAAEQEADRQRRTNRRLRGLLVGAVVFLAVAVVAGSLAVVQRGSARRAADRAEQEARRAEQEAGRAERSATVALSQSLGAQAVSEPRLDRALLLAVEGLHLDPSFRSRSNLLTTLQRAPAVTRTFQGTRFRVNSMALAPDGRLLLVGDNSGSLVVVDTGTGQRVGTVAFDGPEVGLGPDGSLVEAIYERGRPTSFLVVDPATGEAVRTLAIPEEVRRAVRTQHPRLAFAYEPGGDLFAVALGADEFPAVDGFVVQWEYGTGEVAAPPIRMAESGLMTVAYVAGGERLVVIGSHTGVFDPRTGRELRSLPFGSYPAAISPDGGAVAFGSEDGWVDFRDLRNGGRVRGRRTHDGAVETLSFTPDGERLVTSGDDGVSLVWDVRSHEVVETLAGHAGRIQAQAISPDGSTLYTGSFDTTVLAWDLTGTRRFVRSFRAADRDPSWFAYNLAISPDSTTIAVGGLSGRVTLWDVATLRRIQSFEAGPGLISAVSFAPDGRSLLVSGHDDDGSWLRMWRLGPTPAVVREFEGGLPTYTWSTLSPDGRTIVATGMYEDEETGGIAAWDAATGELLADPIRVGPGEDLEGGIPLTAAFAPDGTTVAIGAFGGMAAVVDPARSEVISSFTTRSEFTLGVAFSPDGRTVATADFNGFVRFWDPGTGKQSRPPLHVSEIEASSVAWSPDGTMLAAAGGGTLRLYDVATGRQLGSSVPAGYGTFPYLLFSPDGRYVIASDAAGETWIWPVSVEDWEARACTVANRDLTREEWEEFLPGEPYRQTCEGGVAAAEG